MKLLDTLTISDRGFYFQVDEAVPEAGAFIIAGTIFPISRRQTTLARGREHEIWYSIGCPWEFAPIAREHVGQQIEWAAMEQLAA